MVIAAGGNGVPSIDDVPMVRGVHQSCSTRAEPSDGLRGGQRYLDTVSGLSLLCIRPGPGCLTFAGRTMIPATEASDPYRQRGESEEVRALESQCTLSRG